MIGPVCFSRFLQIAVSQQKCTRVDSKYWNSTRARSLKAMASRVHNSKTQNKTNLMQQIIQAIITGRSSQKYNKKGRGNYLIILSTINGGGLISPNF